MKNNSDKLSRLPNEYTFGIELEFTGGLTSEETQICIEQLIKEGKIREGWQVHYDSSVVDENGKGAEIVSPVLRDDEQTQKEIQIITEFIKKAGGKMDEKVGGHIHFGVQCLGNNIEDIKNFFKLYTIFEPLLYKISTGDLNYVRKGCREYAKPIQKRLTKVIDGNINSLSDLMIRLAANVGANPTHYGENRYYGLNIQRIIEAIRKMPENENMEEFLEKMFKGEPIYDSEGNKISPTIEMRFRNGSSDADEILSGIRMCGQIFVAAKDKNLEDNRTIKSLYRKVKNRPTYVFDKVLNANRTDPNYSDCKDDDEILGKKFKESPYGNGEIDRNIFKVFLKTLYPDIEDIEIEEIIDSYVEGLQPTEYKSTAKEELQNLRAELISVLTSTNTVEEQPRVLSLAA